MIDCIRLTTRLSAFGLVMAGLCALATLAV